MFRLLYRDGESLLLIARVSSEKEAVKAARENASKKGRHIGNYIWDMPERKLFSLESLIG